MNWKKLTLCGLLVAALVLCLSTGPAQAYYIGGDYPPPCKCEPCNTNQPCSSGRCSVSRTQGNLNEGYPVATLGTATIDFSLMYNSYNADNSRAQIDTGLGYGWTHSYNIFLFRQRGHVFRMDGDGLVSRYQRGRDGTFTPTTGYFETLEWDYGDPVNPDDDMYTIRHKDGTTLEFASIPDTPFMVAGPVWRLIRIIDRNGNTTTLTYSGGDLTEITDHYGRSITLGYDAHRLVSITDPLNRATTLGYDPTGRNLTTIADPQGKTVRYTYNFLYQLTGRQDKDGRKTTFLYRDRNPVGIVDGDGASMFNLSNPENWATDSYALARNQLREYVPATTTNTDGRGNQWQYSYDKHGYITQIIAPGGAKTTFTYDPATLMLASKTDDNGHTTSYEYDSNGNLIKQIDALGNVTTYEYEPPFNNVRKITSYKGSTTVHSITEYKYDAKGNRIKEVRDVDGLNLVREWTYYPDGNVQTEKDPNGHVTTYEYDAYGNLIKVTDPEGNITKYKYDKAGTPGYEMLGNRTKVIDANTHETLYEYDDLDRLTKETDPLGYTTEYEHDGEGNRIKVRKQATKAPYPETYQVTGYQFDPRNRLTQEMRDPGGLNIAAKYAYDRNDNRVATTDPRGKVTTFEYDVQNRMNLVRDTLSNTTETRYDGVGNRTCTIDANGHHTFYEYDPLNRLIRETRKIGAQECTPGDADDIVTQYFYNNGGGGVLGCCGATPGSSNISKIIDPEGKITYFKYDKVDRRLITLRKVGDTADNCDGVDDWCEYTEYDPASNVTQRTDANGNATTFTYYDNNWLKTETVNVTETTIYTYEGVGNVKTVKVPSGNITTNTYTPRNELEEVTDIVNGPMSLVAEYSYDGVGNRKTETDGNGNTTTYNYDLVNRLIAVTDAMGETTFHNYDLAGNLIKTTDREGHVTCYLYDDINRRTFTAQLMGGGTNCALLAFNDIWTKTHYDGVGNVISLTTAKHGSTPDQCNSATPPGDCETTKYKYDEVNRLIEETYPDSGIRTFTYDKAGNLKTRKDQKGIITDYNYNDLYYLTLRAYPSSSDSFSYDIGGRMTYAEGGGWVVTFEYDRANRVIVTTQNGQVVKYNYDIPKRFRTITYPAGRIVTEAMDERSRLSTVNRGAGPIFPITPIALYTYDLGNRVLTRQYENSTTATYSYNQNNWITDLTHIGPTPIASFGYDYDKEGNKLFEEKRHDTNRSEAYHYDKIYRLIDYKVGNLVGSTIPVPVTQTQYNLDKLGNWDNKIKDGVSENRTHNVVNEITAIDAVPIIHDDNGNLQEDERYTYAYDEENRLTAVTRKADSKVVGQYQYDALSRRIAKIADPDLLVPNLVTTLYFYDDARIIEEQDTGGFTQATYVYGNYIDEVLTMDRGGQTYYYHQNALWSVAAVTDSAANVAERYDYDAYGCVTITDGVGNPVALNPWGTAHSAIGNLWMFTGRQLDEETGLYFYRARHYDCEKGRFLQRDYSTVGPTNSWFALMSDTRGVPVGTNFYLYVEDGPTVSTDPSGHGKNKPGKGKGIPADKARGIADLQQSGQKMAALCEPPCCRRKCCCKWEPCSPEECKAEARRIGGAVARKWADCWGKHGQDYPIPRRNDGATGATGGYLCWDWAHMFESAAKSINPKCWAIRQGSASGPDSWVHWWLNLWACKREMDECKVMIDDGFMPANGFVHRPPWPNNFLGWREVPYRPLSNIGRRLSIPGC